MNEIKNEVTLIPAGSSTKINGDCSIEVSKSSGTCLVKSCSTVVSIFIAIGITAGVACLSIPQSERIEFINLMPLLVIGVIFSTMLGAHIFRWDPWQTGNAKSSGKRSMSSMCCNDASGVRLPGGMSTIRRSTPVKPEALEQAVPQLLDALKLASAPSATANEFADHASLAAPKNELKPEDATC